MGIGVFPRTETIGLGQNKNYKTLDTVQQQASGIFILSFHLLNHRFISFAAL